MRGALTFPDGEVKDVTPAHVLDYCKVHLKPSRDMDLEYFSSPASLIAALQIDFEHDKEVRASYHPLLFARFAMV